MFELKRHYTVVLVTHNMQQAARVASKVAFIYHGKIVETGEAPSIFENPQNELTEMYVSGKLM